MSELIAVAFDDPHRAEKARSEMLQLEDEDLADLEEAVTLVVEPDGRMRFHHSQHFTVPAALSGGFVGMLAGLILINPIFAAIGGITGAAMGSVFGALKEIGIDEDFMKDLSGNLEPDSSALFVVVRRGRPEKIIERLDSYEGTILKTSLSHQNENKLREALENVR